MAEFQKKIMNKIQANALGNFSPVVCIQGGSAHAAHLRHNVSDPHLRPPTPGTLTITYIFSDVNLKKRTFFYKKKDSYYR